jgi:hypothetical protein
MQVPRVYGLFYLFATISQKPSTTFCFALVRLGALPCVLVRFGACRFPATDLCPKSQPYTGRGKRGAMRQIQN